MFYHLICFKVQIFHDIIGQKSKKRASPNRLHATLVAHTAFYGHRYFDAISDQRRISQALLITYSYILSSNNNNS